MLSQNVSRAADLLSEIPTGTLPPAATRAAIEEARTLLESEIKDARQKGWAQHRFRILLDKGWCEVDGMRWHPHQLGIHVWTNGTVDATHLPSGKRLASFSSLGSAMTFVESIDDLYDWSAPTLAEMPTTIERLVCNSARIYQHESFVPRPIKS